MAGRPGHQRDEADLIPISALQHYVVCPRQAALIHTEQQWAESAETADGRIQHARVDRSASRARGKVRRVTGLNLRSFALGVVGRADVVELEGPKDAPTSAFPVEHKRGRPKRHDGDKVQLCAQAICLEEMLGIAVPAGALFYGERRRRLDVAFDASLRERTRTVADTVRELLESGRTPPAVPCPACPKCSLKARCRPDDLTDGHDRVARYLRRRLAVDAAGDAP